ncbi:MAG: protein kinase, partial [Methanomicrobia archaeon]|nr:protein kinase [Methanomicrobia archaeon]
LPPKLVIHLPSGHHHVLLTGNRSLRRRHLNPSGKEENDTDEVARVVPHPQNPAIWGIRNLTETPWKVTFPDGKTMEVGKDRSVPLNPGTTFSLGSVTAEIRK